MLLWRKPAQNPYSYGAKRPINRVRKSAVFLSPKKADSYTGSARLTTAGYRASACAYTFSKALKLVMKKQFYTEAGGPNNNNNNNPYIYTYIYISTNTI
jgi:hypothetical protein